MTIIHKYSIPLATWAKHGHGNPCLNRRKRNMVGHKWDIIHMYKFYIHAVIFKL